MVDSAWVDFRLSHQLKSVIWPGTGARPKIAIAFPIAVFPVVII